VHRAFVTSPTGPQVGGQTRGGVRADKVGGATALVKRAITHRGWGGHTRTPYPRMGRNGIQPAAPAQLKINDPLSHSPAGVHPFVLTGSDEG
jgi:hypothetical protein